MIDSLHDDLAKITGFAACSGQPNSGAQGEYAGLLSIRSYHQSRDDHERNICIIPVSAHGTNPASAVLAGMKVVVVKSDAKGNIDIEDLRTKVRCMQTCYVLRENGGALATMTTRATRMCERRYTVARVRGWESG